MIINTTVLDSYKDFMEEDAAAFIQEILDEFYTNSKTLLTELSTVPEEDQLEAFVRAAHTLKSTSATVGAVKLSELAATIERKGKEKALTEIAPLLPQLGAAYTEAETELKKIYS